MAESTPPFKLFFGDEENNVNSFSLSREAAFSRFQELLGNLYPRYKSERDVLQYLDADGRKVSFRNDEEYEEMLVRLRDRSLVKLYIEGRIDKSEITPVYNGWWGYPYGMWGPYHSGYLPYWHDYDAWHWGGWGYNRKLQHALQNLWLGLDVYPYRGSLPYWLSGAVNLVDDDFDVNVDALVAALKTQTTECLKHRDSTHLKQAKNLLATHVMIDAQNPEVLYNLAKVEALLGNTFPAFTWLKKAAKSGFNDLKRLKSDGDLDSLHSTYADWEDVVSQVSANSGKKYQPPSLSSEKYRFKFGKQDNSEESSKSAPAPQKEVQKPKEDKAPVKPSGGFLFSLPSAEPEKPKEIEKPAPKPSGFLFALPGAPAPEPVKQPEPQKQQPAPEPPAEVKKWQAQLDVLHGMGFLDDSLLVGFLEKFKGSVEDVLSELLG